MSDLTMNEVLELKAKMEMVIYLMLQEFKDNTGLSVSDISVYSSELKSGDTYLTKVKIDVTL